jgi:pseudouridine synthase
MRKPAPFQRPRGKPAGGGKPRTPRPAKSHAGPFKPTRPSKPTRPANPSLPVRPIGKSAKPAAAASDPGIPAAASQVRLHKYLADSGVASRRAAEELIERGHVSVNGRLVTTLPAWVVPGRDRVEVDGELVGARLAERARLWLMVHKPRRVICTSHDPEGRKSILDLVPDGRRLFCVGRLDADSSGLVLLTDDGEMANRLTHPRYQVPKTYQVVVRGRLVESDLEKLRNGIVLADKEGNTAMARASAVRVTGRQSERTRLQITLREGRNREIRRMIARLGFKVQRLKRLAIGPIELKGVAVGDFRRLMTWEMRALRQLAAGETPARRTGPRPAADKSIRPTRPRRSVNRP